MAKIQQNHASKNNPIAFTVTHKSPLTSTGKRVGPLAVIPGNSQDHQWVKRMKQLSPPRSMYRNQTNKSTRNSDDITYQAWMVHHPSAFNKLNEIIGAEQTGKQIIFFLDYDGTLSPIVDDPQLAFMSCEMRSVVKEVATLFPTAIITGRSREKVYEFVKLPDLYYAGSHGLDIMGPKRQCEGYKTQDEKNPLTSANEMVIFQPPDEYRLVMNEVFKLLEENIKHIDGAKIEHNKFCISVHFRCVKEKNWVVLAELVQNVVGSFPKLQLTPGRKVLEIRPSIAWNKGKAVEYFMKVLGPENQNDAFPIYIGDDKSDEDAFKVINRWKHRLGILVANTSKETNAGYSLRDTNEVLQFLHDLVNWKHEHLSKLPETKPTSPLRPGSPRLAEMTNKTQS